MHQEATYPTSTEGYTVHFHQQTANITIDDCKYYINYHIGFMATSALLKLNWAAVVTIQSMFKLYAINSIKKWAWHNNSYNIVYIKKAF